MVCVITAFVLKLIAAVSMLLDHIGVMLFPRVLWLRILGRLAFPLYAFFIAEGFRYTRNRWKYFLRIFLLGVGCQLVYAATDDELYLGVLITFSFSIFLMAALDAWKKALRGDENAYTVFLHRKTGVELTKKTNAIFSGVVFAVLLAGCALLTSQVEIDYGLAGILFPVIVSVFDEVKLRKIAFAGACAVLTVSFLQTFPWQVFCLATIPLLFLYNGKQGRKMKYFFYLFYPAHLALLYVISTFL